MRIIAGKYKSRKITPPKNLPVRPTTDRAKESLFNILTNLLDFKNLIALDLFSGTGAITFELVSRGCNDVTTVDLNKSCTTWIRKAADNFQMENILVKQADSFRFIAQSLRQYQFIFADPPYNLEHIEDISRQIFKNDLLKEDGWLVVEHPKGIDFSEQQYFSSHRKYGKVNFSFFHFVHNG
jgi:16S rRNA (guanine(966)-N(2))-methyltransferase RsmD